MGESSLAWEGAARSPGVASGLTMNPSVHKHPKLANVGHFDPKRLKVMGVDGCSLMVHVDAPRGVAQKRV